MKTLNEDIKRMMSLMEAKHGVIYPLINEQTSAWDSIKADGADLMSRKTVITEIPATAALTINGNQTTMTASPEGQASVDDVTPYVGARMQAVYREKLTLNALSKMTGTSGLSGRFGCSIEIFVNPTQNGKYDVSSILLFNINIYQNKDGKFIVNGYNMIDKNTKYAKLVNSFNVGQDKYPIKTITPVITKNLSGQLGDTYTKINDELSRLGFPVIPSSLDLSTSVTI
jgi:hypothetical protein